jgi:adenosylhomocysteine nucleosidase
MVRESSEQRPDTDAAHGRGGTIIFAVASRPERRACVASGIGSTNHPVLFVQTGIGLHGMEKLEQQAIHCGAAGLISIGIAGGLAPDLAEGVLLIPEQIRRVNGQVFQAHANWHDRVRTVLQNDLRVETGDLLGVSRVIRHPDEKRALHAQTKAVGADMESAILAEIAGRLGVPFLALRAIADTVEDELPKAAIAALTDAGETDFPALLACLLRYPSDLPGLITTWRRFRVAADTLARACRLAGRQLLITDS